MTPSIPHVSTPRERVEALISKWADIGIGWWRITYVWHDEAGPVENGCEAVMATKASWEYRWATVHIYLGSLPDSDEELEIDLVHEYMHILLSPEQDLLSYSKHARFVEAATHNAALALVWARGVTPSAGIPLMGDDLQISKTEEVIR